MSTHHRFQLQKYSSNPTSKHTCPSCNTPGKFTRYVDTDTGEILNDRVGRCDRENSCGYHYTPKMYFANHPGAYDKTHSGEKPRLVTEQVVQAVKYIDPSCMEGSRQSIENSSLFKFLAQRFSHPETLEVFTTYKVGIAGHWDNQDQRSTLFWQIDSQGRVRQCKCIRYDEATGKRKKGDKDCFFLGKLMNSEPGEFEQTFFGAHLLSRYPDKKVGIVESEKTALVLAIEHPQFLWLATGGAHGCKWTQEKVYGVLEGRVVVFFPDLGMFDNWKNKAAQIHLEQKRMRVSDKMNLLATQEQTKAGLDLADVILYQNKCQ